MSVARVAWKAASWRARELELSASSSRTACSLKTDIRSTASHCMSTEHCDPSDAVRALWLAQ